MTEIPKHLLEAGPALKTIAMPKDTNTNGDIFGGWMLAQMDLAGSVVAVHKSRSAVATVAIDAMTFHQPVFVGDEVSCYGTIAKIGRTSITIHVETWVRRSRRGDVLKVTEGHFTYVAIDDNRKPIPVIREDNES